MLLKYTVVVAGLAAAALAAPTNVDHIVHEKRQEHAHSPWVKRQALPASRELPVRIGMTQSNLDLGHEILMDVASHDSPNYGKWYSAEDIHDIFAPTETSVSALRTWLADHGITRVTQSHNKQWLQFDVPVEKLEDLLQTKYYEFEHVETGLVHPACDQYHVPAHLQEHIDYITPGIKLYTMKTASKHIRRRSEASRPITGPIIEGKPTSEVLAAASSGDLLECSEAISSACIFALYNFTRGTTAVAGNQLGIFESDAQYYSQDDLDLYFAGQAPYVPKGTHPQLRGIDGGGAQVPAPVSSAGGEADLDFEASIPLIYPQSGVLFQVDDQVYEATGTQEGFLNDLFDAVDGSYCTSCAFGECGNSIIDPVYPDNQTGGYHHKLQCGAYKPTHVISISYHSVENLLPVSYQRRQCAEIMKLGLQGTTVIASSGDHGVQEIVNGEPYCIGGDAFTPQFPVNCPYVLAVGATYLPAGKNVTKDQEVATTAFASGGGFSNVYPRPSWQENALDKFFLNHDPGYPYYRTQYNESTGTLGGLYNRAGRGYPDVAAVGWNFVGVFNGFSQISGGTSLSAPVFASILTRINEERLLAGKSTVGFVHPALYANPSMFHDITVGNNPGCDTDGFSCGSGWDPVTGLGTPKYGKMLEYFLSLP